jgi:RHH-type proline utilization regulon transcriptional repressor/proline dehydrogenase/delta 1-pyrroline-5-carboxylate dehydrogenase
LFEHAVDIIAGQPDLHFLVRPYSIVSDSRGRIIVTDPGAPVPFTNEPVAELRRTTTRARFERDVGDAGGHATFVAPVLVDGKIVATDREIASVDPSSFDRVVCRSGCADPEIANRALDAAAEAWPGWRAVPWDERAAILFRAAAILRARRVELTALEVFEAGKPVVEADADVCEAIDFCEYYGREALRLSGKSHMGQVPVR